MAGNTNSKLKKLINPVTGEEQEVDSESGIPTGGFTFNTPATAPEPAAAPASTTLAGKMEGSTAPDLDRLAQSVDDIAETAVAAPSLSQKIGGAASASGQSPEEEKGASGQPRKDTLESLMGELRALKKAPVPGDTTDWNAKLDQAEQMKQEGASRAAWAGLAQAIGEGLVQIASARDAQKHGIAPVSIKSGPPVYESLMKNVENDYKDRIAAINHSHQYSQQERHELIMRAERDYDDSRKEIEDRAGAVRFQQGEDVRKDERAQDRSERARMHGETLAASAANAQFRDTETDRKTGLTQINQSLRELAGRKKAAADLAGKLSTYDDMSSKDQKQFASKNAALLGKAGVTEESLAAYTEPEGSGFFSRTFGEGKDAATARKELIQKNIMAPIQAEESDLLAQRESLSHPGPRGSNSVSRPSAGGPGEGGPGSAPNERGAGTAPAGMVHMRDPASGQERYVRKDQVAAAQKNGAVVVGK